MNRPHHFQGLPSCSAADLETLFKMRLDDDVHQQAALEILNGKSIETALRHARTEVARQKKPSAWTSFDEEKEGEAKLSERLPAPPPTEFEQWRVADLDSGLEALLEGLAAGTAGLGRSLNVSQRRAQQIVKKYVEKFEKGDLEDLFGGVKYEI